MLSARECCRRPGFCLFLPGLCRHLLGEELKLPSVPTWWCGQPRSWHSSSKICSEMVIKSAYPTQGADPVFGQELTREELAELAAEDQDSPGTIRRAESGDVLHHAGLIDEPRAAAPLRGPSVPGARRAIPTP